ncbi:hypothetical protein ACF05T_31710 [Streptomyces lateritius]|uniref:Uncharacterized protein n=1 Tax=Streptomyces lateritius TaxID=67313 RepID=A0ABW6YL30_9ACTN
MPDPKNPQNARDRQDRTGASAEGLSGAPDSAPEPFEPPPETAADRRRRRAQFLRELHEAKALRDRIQPRRARAARMRQAMRMRTFRW